MRLEGTARVWSEQGRYLNYLQSCDRQAAESDARRKNSAPQRRNSSREIALRWA